MSDNKNELNMRVFDQDCADYLRYKGIDAINGERLNSPFRADSDSEAFYINGPFWTDFPANESGNVYQLALKFNNGNKKEAVRELFTAAGVPYKNLTKTTECIDKRLLAEKALKKVKDKFAIKKENREKEEYKKAYDYLLSRSVNKTTVSFLSYIPSVEALKEVLTEEEMEITGLKYRTGLIILWYMEHDRPVYYCTRTVNGKGFKKAPTEIMHHPIWNIGSLYKDEHVVWGEGMFDCLSLIACGYGCCGEITCGFIKAHRKDLLKALRWRKKYHADWTFTICLDNDKITKDGRRPGNEAAESLAAGLWAEGLDVKWVKHELTDEKVDINDLHVNSKSSEIIKMINDAKDVSEVFKEDVNLCIRNYNKMIMNGDWKGARHIQDLLELDIKEMIKLTKNQLWRLKDFYDYKKIDYMFQYDDKVYVFFKSGIYDETQKQYEVYKKAHLVSNLMEYQHTRDFKVKFENLDILSKRPYWTVEKTIARKIDKVYNLFKPSFFLLQEHAENVTLPPQWKLVLENLCGVEEMKWLINHWATYVQTLEKPRTIPIFIGGQGTGKTASCKFFGDGIGSFISVGLTEIESQFNDYLLHAVVLIDEMASSAKDSYRMKNKQKNLINEIQAINSKFEKVYAVKLNNYIAIASNEQITHVPIQIEADDRRYTIITGGKNKDLAKVKEFNYEIWRDELQEFMLYLLSIPIDKDAACSPLMNAKKMELMDQGEDFRIQYIRDFILKKVERGEQDTIRLSILCDEINENSPINHAFNSKTLKPILERIGVPLKTIHNQIWACFENLKTDEINQVYQAQNAHVVETENEVKWSIDGNGNVSDIEEFLKEKNSKKDDIFDDEDDEPFDDIFTFKGGAGEEKNENEKGEEGEEKNDENEVELE